MPDVAIIRATTADERGNLTYEHEGAYLGGLDQAIAARSHGGLVIAQVKRMTAAGSLRPHDVRVPGHLVDLVVVDPEQRQTTETLYDPAISGEIMRPWSSFTLAEHGVEKVVARRAAMELEAGMTANLGFGICSMVPRILLEEGHPRAVTWAIEQGAVGGMPLTGFAFGCASNADAFVPSPSQFTYFQGGGFDMSFLSFLEVDVEGNVNVSKLGKKPYLTAGCGGFVDITANARKIVFAGLFEAGAELELTEDALRVVRPGKFPKMVDAVEHVTFSGRRARETGQEVLYVTERCVIRLTEPAWSRPRSCRGSIPGGTSSTPPTGGCGSPRMPGRCRRACSGPDRWGWRYERAAPDHRRSDRRVAARQPGKLNALTVPMLEALDAHCARSSATRRCARSC